MYGRPTTRNTTSISKANEQEALCTNAFSMATLADQQRSRGAIVAFSTLEGRPSALDYDNSPVLQDWITATDIRVVFNRPKMSGSTESSADDPTTDDQLSTEPETDTSKVNTYGHDLKEYYLYYGLSDLSIGGRCKCNGHGQRCVPVKQAASATSTLPYGSKQMCECRHNTEGMDCERCKPFYYDRPWARATLYNANECIGKTRIKIIKTTLFHRQLELSECRVGNCLDALLANICRVFYTCVLVARLWINTDWPGSLIISLPRRALKF